MTKHYFKLTLFTEEIICQLKEDFVGSNYYHKQIQGRHIEGLGDKGNAKITGLNFFIQAVIPKKLKLYFKISRY